MAGRKVTSQLVKKKEVNEPVDWVFFIPIFREVKPAA